MTYLPAGLPQSGKLPVLDLLLPQNQHFRPAGRGDSLHRFTWNLAQPRGTWVRLAVQNFAPIGLRGWERGPKSWKFPLFGKESPRRGEPFDRFLHLLCSFICRTMLYLWQLRIHHNSLTRFTSQVTELLLRNRASVIYPDFFRGPCKKNYALVGSKKRLTPFWMVSTSSVTMQRCSL